MSHRFAQHLDKHLEMTNYDLFIAIPLGVPLVSLGVFKCCSIEEEGRPMTIDLVPLVIQHIGIILGIDWLSVNHTIIDCEHKNVTFQALNQELFSF